MIMTCKAKHIALFLMVCPLAVFSEYAPLSIPPSHRLASISYVDRPIAPSEQKVIDEDLAAPWLFSGGVLGWKVRVSNSVYAMSSSTSQFTLPFRSSLNEVDFHYQLGFRLGIGYHFNRDDWTLFSMYTYMKADRHARAYKGFAGDLKAPNGFSSSMESALLVNTDLTTVTFDQATSHYDIKYQTVDLLMTKDIHNGKVVFRPLVGLEGAWLLGRQTNFYSGGAILSNNTLMNQNKNRYWGLGPKMGFGSNWQLINYFSLVQNFAFSFLFGDMQNMYQEMLSHSPNLQSLVFARDKRCIPHAFFDLGLNYQRPFRSFFKYVNASLVFEGNYLWSFTQQMLTGEDLSFGSLSLFGLTAQLSIDF